jgi:HSP20 family protein
MAEKTVERRSDWSDWWPELLPRRLVEMFEWPVLSTLREAEHMLRVEEYEDSGNLVVRVEMPGIDPEKDVHIQLRDHALEIRAERKQEEEKAEKGIRKSEFRYGSFFRMVMMPENAKESDIHATYEDGILEVRVPLEATPQPEPKAIPIERQR